LLPPSSTALERDVLRQEAFDQVLDPAVPRIKSPKRGEGILPQWLPWLVIEYGLAELQEFIPDLAELIDLGRDFQEIRGTPAGVEFMAELAGFHAAETYQKDYPCLHFPEFELHLASVPNDPSGLCWLVKAVNLAKPLRSRFRRVFSGYDRRPLVLDKHRFDSGVLLDSFSGVRSGDLNLCSREPNLWISFGRRYDLTAVEAVVQVGCSDGYVRDTSYSSWSHLPFWPVADKDFDGRFHPVIAKMGTGSICEQSGGFSDAGTCSWESFSWGAKSWIEPSPTSGDLHVREQL
jgi:hypothetical protein